MQQITNPKILLLLIFIGILGACKKNEPFGSNGFALLQKSNNQNFSQYVSYDASHNVLVFASFEDVERLFDAIDVYDNNYLMDKGNTSAIFAQYNQIRQYGFTMGNGNGGPNANKVKLQQFQTELLNSYPLSDTVLNGLIDLYDELQPSFPPPFMRAVLEANASYTYEVRENIEQCNLPVGIKNQILEKDDNTAIVPNYAYDDFLGSFSGYQSLYKVLETQQKNQLESGMDPSNPMFDNDIVSDDQLRLILNTEREIYVKRNLIKLYDSCRYAIFQGSITEAYASLAMLDANGFLATPTGVIEPATGLSMSTMNTFFPMNYASVNPNYIVRKENPREGAFIQLDAIDSYLSFCPQSLILYSKPIVSGLEVNFNSITDQYYGSSGTLYQYWTFGDGTGSFQTDPQHIYSSPGTYDVTLTTFNQDCGCWDVEKIDVEVGLSEKGCEVSVSASYINSSTIAGQIQFAITPYNDNPLATITLIGWDFGDGSPYLIGIQSPTHTFGNANSSYTITVTIEYSDGCFTQSQIEVFPFNLTCCDRKDRVKDKTVDIFNDGNYRLKVKAFSNGASGLWVFGSKLKCSCDFYKKKNNYGWKKQKASQIGLGFSGKFLKIEEGICGAETNITDQGLLQYNKKDVNHSYDIPFAFGLKEDFISILFFVNYGNLNNTTTLKLGECNN